jgi:hypothetical protein
MEMHWHTAVVGWLPDGYVLAIKHSLQDREGIRFAELLAARVGAALQVEVTGAKAPDAGLLTIKGRALLDVDAQRLRNRHRSVC